MEFDLTKVYLGSMCTVVLIGFGCDPATPAPPRIWARIRGRYWSAKVDDISLSPLRKLHIRNTVM
jgi:hypothetical protein